MSIKTFKVGLPIKHDLRKSLTMKPAYICFSLWIALMSISGSRRIKPKEREKPKSSPLKEEILDQRGTIIADLEESLLIKPQGLMHK